MGEELLILSKSPVTIVVVEVSSTIKVRAGIRKVLISAVSLPY